MWHHILFLQTLRYLCCQASCSRSQYLLYVKLIDLFIQLPETSSDSYKDSSVLQQIAGWKLLIPLNYWHSGLCLYSSGSVTEWVWEFSIFSPFQWQRAGVELTGDEVNDIDIIRPTFGCLCQKCARPRWQRSVLITRSYHMPFSLRVLLSLLCWTAWKCAVSCCN